MLTKIKIFIANVLDIILGPDACDEHEHLDYGYEIFDLFGHTRKDDE